MMAKLFLSVFGGVVSVSGTHAGDITTINPQLLPPKVYGDGRMLRS
jgi:hypothetical protein